MEMRGGVGGQGHIMRYALTRELSRTAV